MCCGHGIIINPTPISDLRPLTHLKSVYNLLISLALCGQCQCRWLCRCLFKTLQTLMNHSNVYVVRLIFALMCLYLHAAWQWNSLRCLFTPNSNAAWRSLSSMEHTVCSDQPVIQHLTVDKVSYSTVFSQNGLVVSAEALPLSYIVLNLVSSGFVNG